MLLAEGTPTQRAQDTHTHPETVRTFLRRFRQEGMLGLLPADIAVVPAIAPAGCPRPYGRRSPGSKLSMTAFSIRKSSVLSSTNSGTGCSQDREEALAAKPACPQEAFPLGDYHGHGDRYEARVEVIKLYSQGWNKRSISHVFHVSRPTIDRWIHRFEAEHFAGLVHTSDPRRLPQSLVTGHGGGLSSPKAAPDAGGFRIWSLLGPTDISVRTVDRMMALNRQVYDDIPHATQDGPKRPPAAPYKAPAPHEFWFIDGRKMDFTFDGVKWWSVIILDGYSRTMLAGAVAPTEASWVALMVLYTACLRYGVPQSLISDSGGAFTSTEFEAVCTRLQIITNLL